MAAPIDVGHLTLMLQCGICKKTLSNPKSLRCSHSFCKLCLDGLIEFIEGGSGVLKCPNADCEKSSFISCDQTTNDLHVDHIVKGIVNMVKKCPDEEEGAEKVKCEVCTKQEVSRYCIRCKEYKCDTCKDEHDDIREAFVSVRYEQKKLKIFCKDHNTEAKYTCTCGREEFVCAYCIHRGHKSHNYETFTDGEKTLKGMLANRITFSDDLDKQWTEAQDDMSTARSYLHEILLINKINCINEYVDFVNKEEEKLKHDFDLLTAFHTKSFSSTVDSIEYFKDCLTRETMDILLERGEIMNKLNTSMGKSRKIPEVTVSLTNPNFRDKNPLGLMSIRVYGKRFFVSGSRKTFKSDMPEPKVRDPSLQTLESLLKEVLYLPPDFKIDDPSSLVPQPAVIEDNEKIEKEDTDLTSRTDDITTIEIEEKAAEAKEEMVKDMDSNKCVEDNLEDSNVDDDANECEKTKEETNDNIKGNGQVKDVAINETTENHVKKALLDILEGTCEETVNDPVKKRGGRRKKVAAKKNGQAEKKGSAKKLDAEVEQQEEKVEKNETQQVQNDNPCGIGGVTEETEIEITDDQVQEKKIEGDSGSSAVESTSETASGTIVIDDDDESIEISKKEAADGPGTTDDQTDGFLCIDEVSGSDAGDAEEKDASDAINDTASAIKNGEVLVNGSNTLSEKSEVEECNHDLAEKKDERVTNMNGKPEIGVIKFVVENISRVRNTVLSDPVIIQNLQWRIMLMPQYSENDGGRIVRNAGIFVQCDPEVEGSSWLCQAHGKITLKNKSHDDMSKKITEGIFTNEHSCWGHSSFVPWVDILDTRKGFNRGDTVTIEAVVEVDPPLFFKTARVYSNAQSTALNSERDTGVASRKRKLSDEKNTDLLELLCRKKDDCDYSTVKIDRGFGKALKEEK